MNAPVILYRGDAGDFARFMAELPAVLAGNAPDPTGLVNSFKLRLGVALLSQVQQDFLRKSRGQVGKDGIKWEPLKPETIARRRTTAKERKELGIRNKFEGRGKNRKRVHRRSLTPEEDREWRRLVNYHTRIGIRDLPLAEAKRRAYAIAWARIKEQGAKTLLQKLGGRQVDILRDTSAMFRSLTPGVEDQPSGAEGQVFRVALPGVIQVGTTEKPWHQHGDPKKNLPARPMWPEDGKIPAAWWPAVNRAGVKGLKLIVAKLTGGTV